MSTFLCQGPPLSRYDMFTWYISHAALGTRLHSTVTFKVTTIYNTHDDVIKWKHFPRYWPFVRGIHRSFMNSPHKGQWRGALMFSLICARINGGANNREAGDLRRHRAPYDVIVMNILCLSKSVWLGCITSTLWNKHSGLGPELWFPGSWWSNWQIPGISENLHFFHIPKHV